MSRLWVDSLTMVLWRMITWWLRVAVLDPRKGLLPFVSLSLTRLPVSHWKRLSSSSSTLHPSSDMDDSRQPQRSRSIMVASRPEEYLRGIRDCSFTYLRQFCRGISSFPTQLQPTFSLLYCFQTTSVLWHCFHVKSLRSFSNFVFIFILCSWADSYFLFYFLMLLHILILQYLILMSYFIILKEPLTIAIHRLKLSGNTIVQMWGKSILSECVVTICRL